MATLGERSNERPAPAEGNRDDPSPGEANVSGSVGSNDDLDLVDEDLLRSRESRAAGFVGQNSEVQWLRSLKTKMENPEFARSTNQPPYGLPGSSSKAASHRVDTSHARQKSSQPQSILHISNSTFYLDGNDLEIDIMVDPYELPPPKTVEMLFDCYMQTVHTSFPIVPMGFQEQFCSYIESVKRSRPYQVSKSWQAVLNLVLAVGAQYSHLIQAEWRADDRDHIVYMTRATRILGLDKLTTTFPAPTLASIQVICTQAAPTSTC